MVKGGRQTSPLNNSVLLRAAEVVNPKMWVRTNISYLSRTAEASAGTGLTSPGAQLRICKPNDEEEQTRGRHFYTSLPESSTRNKYVSTGQKLQDSVKQELKKKLYFILG